MPDDLKFVLWGWQMLYITWRLLRSQQPITRHRSITVDSRKVQSFCWRSNKGKDKYDRQPIFLIMFYDTDKAKRTRQNFPLYTIMVLVPCPTKASQYVIATCKLVIPRTKTITINFQTPISPWRIILFEHAGPPLNHPLRHFRQFNALFSKPVLDKIIQSEPVAIYNGTRNNSVATPHVHPSGNSGDRSIDSLLHPM